MMYMSLLTRFHLVKCSTKRIWGGTVFRACSGNGRNPGIQKGTNHTESVPTAPVYLSQMENFTNRYLSYDSSDENDTSIRESICKDEILHSFDNSVLKSMLLSTSNAIPFAMRLREDLTVVKRRTNCESTIIHINNFDSIIANFLGSIFCRNILCLKRLTFENSSGAVLQKIAEAEAVHKIRALSEMKKRLNSQGRRCFALFHPSLKNVPLTFVHVSLSRDITTSMSINSPHAALGGLNLAESLLKRTASELSCIYPSIQVHSTLSPIPGFMKWLYQLRSIPSSFLIHDYDGSEYVVSVPAKLKDAVLEAVQNFRKQTPESLSDNDLLSMLCSILKVHGWHLNEKFCDSIKNPLLWLCYCYLLNAKKNSSDSKRRIPLDPVAHFHLRNGAVLHQINWMANIDERGMRSSAGLMVNYRYDMVTVEKRREDFRNSMGIIPAGENVLSFLNVISYD